MCTLFTLHSVDNYDDGEGDHDYDGGIDDDGSDHYDYPHRWPQGPLLLLLLPKVHLLPPPSSTKGDQMRTLLTMKCRIGFDLAFPRGGSFRHVLSGQKGKY